MAIVDRGIVLRQLGRLFGEGTLTGLGRRASFWSATSRGEMRRPSRLCSICTVPWCWAVCRRILRDPRDVEDAFQATFLVFGPQGAGNP